MDGHAAPRIVEAILSVMPVDAFVPEGVSGRQPAMDKGRCRGGL